MCSVQKGLALPAPAHQPPVLTRLLSILNLPPMPVVSSCPLSSSCLSLAGSLQLQLSSDPTPQPPLVLAP